MTIADKLTRLATAHDAIISAINAKGGSATGDGFEDFATDIAAIPSGPSINVEASKSVNVSASGTTTISPSTGYDAMAEAKAVVAAGSAATPATSITANPSISVSSGGLITASVSASQNVTPTVSAGWVSSGTAGAITVSGSNTSQLTTQGTQTIYPSSSDQSISSGRYLTGAQTIKGVAVANLTAANIKKDVVVTIGDSADADRIMSVTGTYEGGGGGVNIGTAEVTVPSQYPSSISFTDLQGEPQMFVVRQNETSISSSGSTTYYYVIAVVYDGSTTVGNYFRIGSTRTVYPATSGYSWTYNNGTLTVTSSAATRNAVPGAFYSSIKYELIYVY